MSTRSNGVERFFAGARNRGHSIAQLFQTALDVGGDDAFVFNDQDLFGLFRGGLHVKGPSWNLSGLRGASLSAVFCGVAPCAAAPLDDQSPNN
jgi:hypothetical protein